MRIVSFAQKADFLLGFVCLGIALYLLVSQSYLPAAIWAMSAGVSFLLARFKPSRWLAKRLLIARLKH